MLVSTASGGVKVSTAEEPRPSMKTSGPSAAGSRCGSSCMCGCMCGYMYMYMYVACAHLEACALHMCMCMCICTRLEEGILTYVDCDVAHGADRKGAARCDPLREVTDGGRQLRGVEAVAVAPRRQALPQVRPLEPSGHTQVVDDVVERGLDLAARGHEVHSGLAVVRIASHARVVRRHDEAARTRPPHALHIALEDGPVSQRTKGRSRRPETPQHLHDGPSSATANARERERRVGARVRPG
eukprot:scaffold127473_cov66-Phaeocystis_antarctica.AAC.2